MLPKSHIYNSQSFKKDRYVRISVRFIYVDLWFRHESSFWSHSGCVLDQRHCLWHVSPISSDLTLDP